MIFLIYTYFSIIFIIKLKIESDFIPLFYQYVHVRNLFNIYLQKQILIELPARTSILSVSPCTQFF